jgi:hypothetical protein
LPLTTGPVIFFLAVEQGPAYAATAAAGTFSGGISLIVFALSYSWLAQYFSWFPTVITSGVIFMTLTFILRQVSLAVVPLFIGLIGGLLMALRLMPPLPANTAHVNTPMPRWDLPARMLIATGIVFGLTSFSTLFGARFTGLLATFPVYTAILAAFAHQLQGPLAAARVLQGLLLGLFAFAVFYVILSVGLEPLGVTLAFLAALGAAGLVQGGSLFFIIKKPA